MNKNSFIYEQNNKIGRVLIVEGENNTSEIHNIKEDKNVVFTIEAPWWDMDGINVEIKKNEKQIKKALNDTSMKNIHTLIGVFADAYEQLDEQFKAEIRNEMKERLNWK